MGGVGGAGGGGGAPGPSRDIPGVPSLPTAPLAPGLDDTGVGGPPGQAGNLPPPLPDLLCVTFSAATSQDGSTAFARSFNLSVVGRFQLSGLRLQVYLMRLPSGADFTDTLRRASADRRALSVQPDFE
ncbi:MAG TPA: hypothetical protein VGM59_03140, partial [Dongiaceae bacterium]